MILLNYILGMMGDLKGVVYYYCGVMLNVMGNIILW